MSSGPNAGTYFVHPDHLGSLNVLSNSSGLEVQRLRYIPFGETHSNVGSVDFDRYRYTGQEEDPETGLYYYNARYYNPTLARFLSPDPALSQYLAASPGEGVYRPENLSLFSYAGNNPVTNVDPDGLKKIYFEVTTFIAERTATVPWVGRTFLGDYTGSQPGASSFRSQQTFLIETDPRVSKDPVISSTRNVGRTVEIDPASGEIIRSKPGSKEGLTVTGWRDAQENAIILVETSAKNPLVWYSYPITNRLIIFAQAGSEEFTVVGTLGGFPSTKGDATFESGSTVPFIQFDPRDVRNTEWSLFPGIGDQDVNVRCTSDGCTTSSFGGPSSQHRQKHLLSGRPGRIGGRAGIGGEAGSTGDAARRP